MWPGAARPHDRHHLRFHVMLGGVVRVVRGAAVGGAVGGGCRIWDGRHHAEGHRSAVRRRGLLVLLIRENEVLIYCYVFIS